MSTDPKTWSCDRCKRSGSLFTLPNLTAPEIMARAGIRHREASPICWDEHGSIYLRIENPKEAARVS